MNALTRFERMDDLFPEMFRRFMRPMPAVAGLDDQAEIRLDVTEREKDFLVRAQVPGAKKDDVRVQIDRNYVSITSEVRQQKEKKDEAGRVLLQESSYGAAVRGFSLPCEIDDKASNAKLEDGVLTLTLPKREGGGSRMLPIQ